MARKTKIMGFSLPPETYAEIEKLLKTSHKRGNLNKLQWVEPMKVFHYFTTSTADEVIFFLGTL